MDSVYYLAHMKDKPQCATSVCQLTILFGVMSSLQTFLHKQTFSKSGPMCWWDTKQQKHAQSCITCRIVMIFLSSCLSLDLQTVWSFSYCSDPQSPENKDILVRNYVRIVACVLLIMFTVMLSTSSCLKISGAGNGNVMWCFLGIR